MHNSKKSSNFKPEASNGVINYMNYKVDSGKLFEGLDEIIAKTMKDASMRVLTSRAVVEPNQHEIVGNTAVKADAPLLEQPTAEGADVYVDIEEWYEFLEWRNGRKEKDQDRIARYKELYEAVRAEIDEERAAKDEMREDYEERLSAKDEEIKKLKAQLEYAEQHPQRVTNVFGDQHNHLEDNRSQVAVQEMKVESGSIGVQTSETKEEENEENDDIGFCEYIEEDKIDQITRYGKTKEERLYYYNRIIYRAAQKNARTFAKFLKNEEGKGLVYFAGEAPSKIYAYFKEIYGFLPYDEAAFRSACHYAKWQPANKRKRS